MGVAALVVATAGVAQAAGRGNQVIYKGPIHYSQNCPGEGPNTSTTTMDADGDQQGCQRSYDGGHEVQYSDCTNTRHDQGTWTYKPTSGGDNDTDDSHGADTFTYNGTYEDHNAVTLQKDGTYFYSGEEHFTDKGVGEVNQKYSAVLTYDANCNLTSASKWYVQVKGTGGLAFLTETGGTRPHQHG